MSVEGFYVLSSSNTDFRFSRVIKTLAGHGKKTKIREYRQQAFMRCWETIIQTPYGLDMRDDDVLGAVNIMEIMNALGLDGDFLMGDDVSEDCPEGSLLDLRLRMNTTSQKYDFIIKHTGQIIIPSTMLPPAPKRRR